MKIKHMLVMAGMAAVLSIGSGSMEAQERPRRGGGDFDPEQIRQRIMERYREQLGVQNDAEWKVIQERVEGVMEARQAVGGRGGGPFFGRSGGRGGPGGAGGDRGRGFRGGGQGDPEAQALRRAIESNASAEELKTKLANFREARKQKEAELAKAQEELRQVLSVRQEAQSVLIGLLD